MDTAPDKKPELAIKAEFIGPIISLDDKLSDQKQNLIFARNGAGKSFLARALRLLDEAGLEGVPYKDIPDLLVSDEAPKRQGSFQLFEGENCIGGIGLNARDGKVTFSDAKYISHVFSEDYIDHHLRQHNFELNGEITHEIIVGRENVELDQKEAEKKGEGEALITLRQEIDRKFKKQKEQLQKNFHINAGLGNYRSLNTDTYFSEQEFNDNRPEKTATELLKSYNKFKSLPSDPKLPHGTSPDDLGVSLDDISTSLAKITSPSSVADEVKRKIATNIGFFKSGIALKQSSNPECPFCTQTLTETALAVIATYEEYFADAEAKEKDALSALKQLVESASGKVDRWRNECLTAKSHFDDLRVFSVDAGRTGGRSFKSAR